MNLVVRVGRFLRDLGGAIAEAGGDTGGEGEPRQSGPATASRARIGIPDDRPMLTQTAVFRSREAALEFAAFLKEKGIESELGPTPSGRGAVVGVAEESDEVALEYLAELYSVPEAFPKDATCPSCELRVVEELGLPGFRWYCLRCGQLWK
jgi:hypothetical protein